MFYLVRYYIQVNNKLEYHNSIFIHPSYDSALKEANSKKFYCKYPVINFYIDILIFNEEV